MADPDALDQLMSLDAESSSDLAMMKEAYDTEAATGTVKEETKFNYAWCLVRSANNSDIRLGLDLLQELMDVYGRAGLYLYYRSWGFYRLGDYREARAAIDRLLAVQPRNRQALSMRALIDDRVTRDGLVGVAIVGTLVAVLGVVGFMSTRGSNKS